MMIDDNTKRALASMIAAMNTLSTKKQLQALDDFFVAVDGFSATERAELREPYVQRRDERAARGKAYSEVQSYTYPGFVASNRDCVCTDCGGDICIGDPVFILKKGKRYQVWHALADCLPAKHRRSCMRNKRYIAWLATGVLPTHSKQREFAADTQTETSMHALTQTHTVN